MSQNDLSIANQSGGSFRSDLNNALQALASVSSGASAPSTTYAYQVWLDTTTATAPIIKQRNSANNAWLTIGTVNADATISMAGTSAFDIPVGTTAQRPTANAGQIRYNTTLSKFEGNSGSAWESWVSLNASNNLVFADGAGLDFSASAGGGASSSIFHDYEEGTYNPTFTCGSGTIAVDSSFNTLAYTKVGRVVHLSGEIKVGATSSSSGTLDISLPFTSMTTSETSALGQFSVNSDIDINNSALALFLKFGSASANARFVIQQDNSTWDNIPAQDVNTGDLFAFSGFYFASA